MPVTIFVVLSSILRDDVLPEYSPATHSAGNEIARTSGTMGFSVMLVKSSLNVSSTHPTLEVFNVEDFPHGFDVFATDLLSALGATPTASNN